MEDDLDVPVPRQTQLTEGSNGRKQRLPGKQSHPVVHAVSS